MIDTSKEVFSLNLKKYMKSNNKTQADICNALNISKATFSTWVNGSKFPRMDKVQMLADYFNILKSDLIENSKSDIAECFIKLPLYSPICCGNGGFVDDNVIEYISIPVKMLKSNKEYFANYAVGNSMIGENIKDNDLIIFEKANTIENGQIGCFCVNDEDAMCKIFRCDAKTGFIMLLPANSEFDAITVSPDVDSFRVIGKLAFVLNDRQSD